MIIRSRFATALCAAVAMAWLHKASAQESPVFRVIPFASTPALARFGDAIPEQPQPTLLKWAEDAPELPTRPARGLTLGDNRDLAWAVLGDEERALALALADWRRAPSRSIEQRRLRGLIAGLYAARNFAPLWLQNADWRPSAGAVARRLRAAGEDGLDLSAYNIPAVDAGGKSRPADELALAEAVSAYIAQASGSRVDPSRISHLIGARPETPDLAAALTRLAAADEGADEMLQDYNPPHYGYRLLREKLAELRGRHALSAADRLAEAGAADPLDDSPSAARRAARRNSAAPAGATTRVEAEILANMERWRWLPRELGQDHVEINIPEFELAVVRGGAVAHRTRVIVGKEQTPTPIFSNALQFIIVNPSWNVPQSIINKEMLPKHGGNLSSFAARGWKVAYRGGKLTLRQPPGEDNALGRIKFMFPNDFSVYMHDTPSRNLFSASRRAFSHGCMRVEDPFALAEAVLGPGSGWSEARVKRLLGNSERYINLKTPLPIHIEYFTAFVDEYGRLQQREDIYGYSARVRRELGLGG